MCSSDLKYNFLSSSAVAQYLEAVQTTPSKWGRGVAFFRYGIPGEALVLDAWRLKDAITISFGSKVKIRVDFIKTAGPEFFLALTNLGRSTYFGKTGLKLTMPSIIEVDKGANGDFERILKQKDAFVLEEDYFKRREMLITPLLRPLKQLNRGGIVKIELERSDGITVPLEFELYPLKESQIISN